MMHKNTVQHQIRQAEESLGRPMSDNRQDVELALQPATGSARMCCKRLPSGTPTIRASVFTRSYLNEFSRLVTVLEMGGVERSARRRPTDPRPRLYAYSRQMLVSRRSFRVS
jgi:hypothetical protein